MPALKKFTILVQCYVADGLDLAKQLGLSKLASGLVFCKALVHLSSSKQVGFALAVLNVIFD